MEQKRKRATDILLKVFDAARLRALPFHPAARYAAAWVVVMAWSAGALLVAWNNCNQPARRDGNNGHANIDFCGQWLLGRIVAEGRGRQLYDRTVQRDVLERSLPVADQAPDATDSDAEMMLFWMVGTDDPDNSYQHIGGPLYPPVHALFFSPLGLLEPRPAYRLTHFLNLGIAFLCGLLIRNLSAGRVWWPVAVLFVFVFPGFGGSINLGQNALLSLAVLLTGWWQLRNGRPVVAGIVWGFLAFKPVWAVSFFLVPLLTRRWRMAAAMAATGASLAIFTLPVVGWISWINWLKVGGMASERYAECETWIILSRDLTGMPRRWMLDFAHGYATNADWLLPTQLGWGLWLIPILLTIVVVWLRRRDEPAVEGPAAAFVLLGAWLSCYHFMYYDALLAALPVCLLLTNPWQYLDVRLLRNPTPCCVRNSLTLTLLVLLCALPPLSFGLDPTCHGPPFETFCLLALWAWCGWQWVGGKHDCTNNGRRNPDNRSISSAPFTGLSAER